MGQGGTRQPDDPAFRVKRRDAAQAALQADGSSGTSNRGGPPKMKVAISSTPWQLPG